MGAGASLRRRSCWCHQCQANVQNLTDGGACPHCHTSFAAEGSGLAEPIQANRWHQRNARGRAPSAITEARIARLLDDLHAQLEMVEGLHETMRRTVFATAGDQLRRGEQPTFSEIMSASELIEMDVNALKSMRQAAQCVVCCADFEVGERLCKLPGCGHIFHEECVRAWLQRTANCPICRCDLVHATSCLKQEALRASGSRSPEVDGCHRGGSSLASPLTFRRGLASSGQSAHLMSHVPWNCASSPAYMSQPRWHQQDVAWRVQPTLPVTLSSSSSSSGTSPSVPGRSRLPM